MQSRAVDLGINSQWPYVSLLVNIHCSSEYIQMLQILTQLAGTSGTVNSMCTLEFILSTGPSVTMTRNAVLICDPKLKGYRTLRFRSQSLEAKLEVVSDSGNDEQLPATPGEGRKKSIFRYLRK